MTFTERLGLLGFGLFTWSLSMFTAFDPEVNAIVASCAAPMAGVGAGCFTTALLPGRMARFS